MDDHPDSAELMRDFVERSSHEAFRTLVDRYLPVVYGAAIRRTGNAALEEDVAQLVFADFAMRLPTLRADNRIGAWLHRAATLKARDVMKCFLALIGNPASIFHFALFILS
jgi:DNA-directed RNA polymerase specialized sigma24 family protein